MTRREIDRLLYNAVAEALGVDPVPALQRKTRAPRTASASRGTSRRVAAASRQLETV